MKKCSRCGKEKPFEEFSKLSQAKDGYRYACRSCMSKDYFDNRSQRRITIRNWRLRTEYGITVSDYDNMLEDQNNQCAICDIHISNRSLDVDHNHTTGKVRGLLCNNCNRGIGHLQDSSEILAKALDYLERHKEDETLSD